MIKKNEGITSYISKIKITDLKKLKDRSIKIKEAFSTLKD